MSDKLHHVIERIEPVLTSPTVQKTLAAIPIGSGSAAYLEITQGWLAAMSILIGIVAGILVIIYNLKRNKIASKDMELKDIEIQIKTLEVERLKREENA